MSGPIMRKSLLVVSVILLSACAQDDPVLMHAAGASNSDGPDEFSVSTNRALIEPESYAALPTPTPGGSNLADIDAVGDAVTALGGRSVRSGGIPASSPLLAYASRFGYVPNIRSLLAAEDLEFRRRNNGKIMERLFDVNVYFDAYEPQSLDQQAELERFRALGVLTPASPPDPS